MPTYRSVLGIAVVLFALMLTSTSAQAQVTFSGPSTVTLTEDGTIPLFNYTIMNNSGGPIMNFGVNPIFGVGSGDPSDLGAGSFSTGGCLGVTLANGSSCNFIMGVGTPSGAGETDADSWSSTFTLGAHYTLASGGLGKVSESVFVKVNDPVTTPEPGSLLLLGSGALGLLGPLRRKLCA